MFTANLPLELWLTDFSTTFLSALNVCFQQLGVQGKGFEPTIEALFGKNGFFPDTLSKTLYWAMDKIPEMDKWFNIPEGRKVFDLKKKITDNKCCDF